MAVDTLTHQRENGIYYTPEALAEHLASPLIVKSGISLLDPAYGEGSLLLAAEKIYSQKISSKRSGLHLFGCDTKPVNGLLKHLPEANLKKINFFDYPIENKFSVILMNPPYVRHHLLDSSLIKKIKEHFPKTKVLSNSADLWAYFMVKAFDHLKPEGSIGAILPWAFLQADYSKPLREKVSDVFGEIKILSLSDKYFEKAQERVVLVWLNNFGNKCKSIKIGSSKHISESISFNDLSLTNWLSDKVLANGESEISTLLYRFGTDFGFKRFDNYAEVKIGIVTGADEFFILDQSKIKELGFKRKYLKPIITTSKDFNEVLNNGIENLKSLVVIGKKDYALFRGFVQRGRNREFHLRAHSTLRNPWYSVKVGKTPDSFFPYRTSITPFLMMNTNGIQCTNSIHRIYFRKLTQVERKWLHVSLLSTISQLSIEVNSKTYGRGMLKIEPKSLKKSLVLVKKDRLINSVYTEVQRELKKHNKAKAVEIASNFLYEYLGVSNRLIQEVKTELARAQNTRLS